MMIELTREIYRNPDFGSRPRFIFIKEISIGDSQETPLVVVSTSCYKKCEICKCLIHSRGSVPHNKAHIVELFTTYMCCLSAWWVSLLTSCA